MFHFKGGDSLLKILQEMQVLAIILAVESMFELLTERLKLGTDFWVI